MCPDELIKASRFGRKSGGQTSGSSSRFGEERSHPKRLSMLTVRNAGCAVRNATAAAGVHAALFSRRIVSAGHRPLRMASLMSAAGQSMV